MKTIIEMIIKIKESMSSSLEKLKGDVTQHEQEEKEEISKL